MSSTRQAGRNIITSVSLPKIHMDLVRQASLDQDRTLSNYVTRAIKQQLIRDGYVNPFDTNKE